jgi:hypothetical protein
LAKAEGTTPHLLRVFVNVRQAQPALNHPVSASHQLGRHAWLAIAFEILIVAQGGVAAKPMRLSMVSNES